MPTQRNILRLLVKTLQNIGAENKPDLLHIFPVVRDCAEQVAAGREEGRAHAGRALEDELIFAQAMANSGNTIDVLAIPEIMPFFPQLTLAFLQAAGYWSQRPAEKKVCHSAAQFVGKQTRIRLIILAGNQDK